jgi:uncharacterized protein YlxW (UPF0749 family)
MHRLTNLRPTRRGVITSFFALLLVAALASALTTKIAVSHYRTEHAAALRMSAQHDSLLAERNRFEQRAESLLTSIQSLETRLANDGNDLR